MIARLLFLSGRGLPPFVKSTVNLYAVNCQLSTVNCQLSKIFLRICIRLLRKFWRRNQKVDRPFGF
ncbi:MAG: hypothetical protein JGK01_26310 [Microcoleus sp. PH2017_03_ELD_O_A]|uniref:hypothetical protein n=1 Tax=unclassified Microcoleus TaxID=2642155 RepID=UPI001D48F27F|nr:MULTISPECIES: hypothetical protein [unclassified Microcoleus]MCC3445125.1 hypothetical protein [Microcoleus sp. PH2017_03_ELD_O_A]MCC3512789.1 hypothetical protein [Microcoleus sp. PH2017_17_BER_D_A]MCC3549918.1 hypothetical protein [Microcoleus sp. PH2017_24_DOB_U_A]MCC3565881.1 hypothetical protein [Microcoleus sp. PH2017_31_RDM_U_A]MCC3624839.1 hypothetical protein [Microcoleus sp. PH2017_36_ELK_O_B]